MNTEQELQTAPMPSILDIKPVEQIQPKQRPQSELKAPQQKPDELEQLGDLKKEEIFIKPQKQKRPKRPMTERQKKHMEAMRAKRMENLAKKKAEKQAQQPVKQADHQPVKQAVKQQPVQQQPVQQQPVKQPVQQPVFNKRQAGREYMQEFFQNMNMFVESASKLNNFRQQQRPQHSQLQSTPHQQPKKQKPAPKKNNNNSDDTYFIDFLKPKVNYDFNNSFGM